ncbi:transposase, partial [Paraburkholderia sp. SIMBA_049]
RNHEDVSALQAKRMTCSVKMWVILRLKAGVRAKVEHPFRVLKCQFGYLKARYRGLAKNTAHIETQFALANLWMARKMM